MSFAAYYDVKEQVRQAVDIVELVGSHMQLRRQGRMYVGLCPWHDDARPSLQVNPQRQSWRCWVCGIGGDVFAFVMQRERVEFREALELLADRAGIALQPQGKAPEPGSPRDKRTLYQALAWAAHQFHQCLIDAAEAEPARNYLHERGIDQASIRRFQLGFSPNQWQWLLDRARTTAWDASIWEATGLAGRSAQSGSFYDRFRGRVIFPICDAQSRPIAFGGRILPEWADERSAKYINSPETRLFSKSQQLYGLDLVRDAAARSRQIVVVEGYTDVVMAHQFGVNQVVAVLGTALTAQHVQVLRRYADRITLVLDGDEAGQRRTNEVLELFVAADVDLRILTLPSGLDPCDYLRQQGADAFGRLLEQAPDALEHKVRIETAGIDLLRDTHRAHQGLEHILSTLAKAPRQKGASMQQLREQQLLTRLARQFQVPQAQLAERLVQLRRSGASGGGAAAESEQAGRSVRQPLPPREAELLEILILHPELVAVAAAHIQPEQLVSPSARAVFYTFTRLADQGQTADFDAVMTELEDGELKNLLVQLDELATAKAAQVQEPAAARLEGLVRDLAKQQSESECRQRLAALENRSLDEQEEYNTFLEFVQKERDRRGISAPTDG